MKILALRGSFILGLILVVGGCTSVSDAGYFWGKYPYTFLETIRNPSTEASEKHIAELRKIVDYSMENGLKPAPGIYAELAFWLSKAENRDDKEIAAFFAKEMQIYPESRPFIERLTTK